MIAYETCAKYSKSRLTLFSNRERDKAMLLTLCALLLNICVLKITRAAIFIERNTTLE